VSKFNFTRAVKVRLVIAVLAWGFFLSTVQKAEANLTPSQQCHVENIYHESRGEGWLGWALVKATVENRVLDSRWPSTVCEVVYQDSQFSWTLDPQAVTDMPSWNRISKFVTEGSHSNFNGVTHYHTTAINPWWASSYEYIGTAGDHKYYK
jgi:spore germination cell wall hydrolase CwlJ-like protein